MTLISFSIMTHYLLIVVTKGRFTTGKVAPKTQRNFNYFDRCNSGYKFNVNLHHEMPKPKIEMYISYSMFYLLLILPLNSIVKRIWMDSMHWISMVLLIFYLWCKVSGCAVVINHRNMLWLVFWDVSPLQYFLEEYQINKIGQRTGMFPPNPMIWSQNLHNRSTVSDTIFTRNTRL